MSSSTVVQAAFQNLFIARALRALCFQGDGRDACLSKSEKVNIHVEMMTKYVEYT